MVGNGSGSCDAAKTGHSNGTRGIDRRAILASGAALGTSLVAGCSDVLDSGGGGGSATNIAIVSSPAGFDDNAFNDLALEGLQNAAEEYDIEINQVEETNTSQYQSVQADLAASTDPSYDVIVLVSYNHTEALTQNAAEYPDQNWMLINDHVDQPNVAGYTWANHQMSYLAGVLGGTMTTEELSYDGSSTTPGSAHIGFVGGVDGSLINAFERAYVAGAEWVNADVDVEVGYIGNYTDTETAANIASSQYDAGADIVYHAAAAAGAGVFQSAQDNDRFAIGVDADQSRTLPDYADVILGSAVKYINEGTYEVAVAAAEDTFDELSGRAHTLGLEEGAVACVIGQEFEGDLPDAVASNLEEARQGIMNGDISVPCTASGCN